MKNFDEIRRKYLNESMRKLEDYTPPEYDVSDLPEPSKGLFLVVGYKKPASNTVICLYVEDGEVKPILCKIFVLPENRPQIGDKIAVKEVRHSKINMVSIPYIVPCKMNPLEKARRLYLISMDMKDKMNNSLNRQIMVDLEGHLWSMVNTEINNAYREFGDKLACSSVKERKSDCKKMELLDYISKWDRKIVAQLEEVDNSFVQKNSLSRSEYLAQKKNKNNSKNSVDPQL